MMYLSTCLNKGSLSQQGEVKTIESELSDIYKVNVIDNGVYNMLFKSKTSLTVKIQPIFTCLSCST